MPFLLSCRNRINLSVVISVFAAVLFSCEKDPEPFYNNGVITGTILVNTESSPENYRIIARGPYGSKSSISDANGKYELSRLGNGTYDLEFSKEGYGTYRKHSVQIFGNDTLKVNARLYEKAEYSLPSLSQVLYYPEFESMNEYSAAIVTDVPDDNYDRMEMRVFLSDKRDVSFTKYLHTDIPYTFHRGNATQLMIFNANPYIVNTDEHVFESGQTVYMIAYVCNVEDPGYFDEYYGLPIYTTVDEQQHSRIFEIIAP